MKWNTTVKLCILRTHMESEVDRLLFENKDTKYDMISKKYKKITLGEKVKSYTGAFGA